MRLNNMIQWIRNRCKAFKREEQGSALVEVALVMPILAMLLLLSFETARYILVQQKASRVTSTINDLLARVADPENQMDDIVNAAGLIMSPFSLGSHSVAVSSLLYQAPGEDPEIIWQDRGAGSGDYDSELGQEGDVPTLPNDFEMRDNEAIIVTEFFYTYTPLFKYSFWEEKPLYYSAFNKPRLQDLDLLTN